MHLNQITAILVLQLSDLMKNQNITTKTNVRTLNLKNVYFLHKKASNFALYLNIENFNNILV